MYLMNEVYVDEEVVERLIRNIIIKENHNLKTKEKNHNKMVSWIKKKIEEEVKCYLNQLD